MSRNVEELSAVSCILSRGFLARCKSHSIKSHITEVIGKVLIVRVQEYMYMYV